MPTCDPYIDGGPAFPINGQYNDLTALRGMSLRDWFAGMALNSFPTTSDLERDATRAYEIADAMLMRREKR
jgi:hypothetical protein